MIIFYIKLLAVYETGDEVIIIVNDMSDHIMWHFFLKILYRQRGNDRTSWLGDVQIRMCHSPGANHMHSEVHSDTTI